MNYIHKLQADVAYYRKESLCLEQTIRQLEGYLLSPKFHNDTTVQVADVMHRLGQGLNSNRQTYEEMQA